MERRKRGTIKRQMVRSARPAIVRERFTLDAGLSRAVAKSSAPV